MTRREQQRRLPLITAEFWQIAQKRADGSAIPMVLPSVPTSFLGSGSIGACLLFSAGKAHLVYSDPVRPACTPNRALQALKENRSREECPAV